MNAPIIFIHFSNSSYLKYTLRSAVVFNPDKRVILLGDKTNEHFKHKGVEHYFFDDYASGEGIDQFDRTFQFITGGEYLNEYKSNFFFRRWFLMYNFVMREKMKRFWTFDSDNLVLTALSAHEHKFADYDCTEQCDGGCMNGLINSMEVVKGYLDKINELFQRKDYLAVQEKKVRDNPRFIFNEMDAYSTYKKEEVFRSIKLNTIMDGTTFDHCISSKDDMEMLRRRIRGKKRVKQIYADDNGCLFTYHLPSKKFIKLNTVNMSWRIPDFLIRRMLQYALRQLKNPSLSSIKVDQRNIKPFDMYESWLMGKLRKAYAKLRKHLFCN